MNPDIFIFKKLESDNFDLIEIEININNITETIIPNQNSCLMNLIVDNKS